MPQRHDNDFGTVIVGCRASRIVSHFGDIIGPIDLTNPFTPIPLTASAMGLFVALVALLARDDSRSPTRCRRIIIVHTTASARL